jgi:hypothetical protein
MVTKPKSFENAITSADFSSEDYCGTSYAARLLGLSVATVQSLVEKGEIEAWKTLAHRPELHQRLLGQEQPTAGTCGHQPETPPACAAGRGR